jgi:hypothetical protein
MTIHGAAGLHCIQASQPPRRSSTSIDLLWRPRFLISLISANDRFRWVKHCWHWSNLGQHGSSPRKLSHQALTTLLIKSTTTCGQPLVKTPVSLNSLWNFCRVLQISPKHSKISQYKSCSVFRGTQLCFLVPLQIWSGNWWKTWSTAAEYYSLAPWKITTLPAVHA